MRASTTFASVTVGWVPPRPQQTGPGIGAGALGSDLQDPGAIDMRNTAAARPMVCTSIIAGAAADGNPAAYSRDRRLAVDHHRDIEAGAAHVAGDERSKPPCAASSPPPSRPRPAGAHDVGGAIGKLAHRHDAAVRLHDQRCRSSPFGELLEQRLGVARHQRLEITWITAVLVRSNSYIRGSRRWRSPAPNWVLSRARMSRMRSSCAGLA